MGSLRKIGAVAAFTLSFCWLCGVAAQQADQAAAKPKVMTIQGLVRDVSCPIQNKESTSKKFNLECAKECAKRGVPLVILTDDGTTYFPVSDVMPDTDHRDKLMPFVGKYVKVTGEVFERAGTHAVVIKTIKEDTSVQLNTGAFAPE